MNVYTNNTFKGICPTGTAAIVVAKTNKEAAAALNRKLKEIGLHDGVKSEEMVFLSTTFESVTILNDGDY